VRHALARRSPRRLELVDRQAATVRCAIYTRKSTDEGLDSDFNSLDAQREAGEAFIQSQRSEGWVCLPDRYDDGGFSGGNVERPALQRLLGNIAAGRVDCVVVYKVDRLSRSLLDFARIMEIFQDHHASFVSVTQQFNTSTSMGRLMLNVLLSFAQFEREIIGERTRDKLAAARRRGKWIGGQPVLGYDIDREKKRLVVNKGEAKLVKQIFGLYIKAESMDAVIAELDRRGVRTKSWITKKGRKRGGGFIDKNILSRMLTNVLYVGKVAYKDEVHPGEHEAIVDDETFRRASRILRANRFTGGAVRRNRHGALLKGILRCGSCDCPTSHTFTRRKGRLYRYYICNLSNKRGAAHGCPTKQMPAQEIEDFVVARIRGIGTDEELLREVVGSAGEARAQERSELEADHARMAKELARNGQEAREYVRVIGQGKSSSAIAERLSELETLIQKGERRCTEIREKLIALERETIDEADLRSAVAAFDPIWDVLIPRERERIVRLLVEAVWWDRAKDTVKIRFRPAGIRTLAEEARQASAADEK